MREEIKQHNAKTELLEKLFDKIPVMINSYDPNLDSFQVNHEFERVTGWKNEEIDNIDLPKACFPDPELREEVREFMRSPNSGWLEFPITTKSGEKISSKWTNVRLSDKTRVGIGIDITEQKRNEERLQLQKQKLELAQKMAGIGYWEYDIEKGKTIWPDSIYQIYGYDREDLPPSIDSFMEILHPEDRSMFENAIETLLEEESMEHHYRVIQSDGEIVYCYSRSEAIYNEDGEPSKFMGTVLDLTDIKQMQANKRESQRLLRKTFESLHSAVCIVEPGTRKIIDCNWRAQEIFGYSREELIGSSTQILHVDKKRHLQFDEIGTRELEENGVFQTEFVLKRKNGELFHSDHTVTLVRNEQGEIEQVVSVVRDITEKKKKERELKQSRERLARAQQVGKLGDWEFDLETEEIHWSPMVFEIFERDPEKEPPTYEELVQSYFSEVADLHDLYIKKAINEGKPYDIDLPLLTGKGNKKYIRAIGIPIEGEDGKVKKLMGVVQDITERKQAKQKLHESEEKYREMFQHNPQPMWIYNPETLEFVEVNRAAVSHYGYSEKEFKNMTLADIQASKDQAALEENVQENLETHVYGEESKHVKKDGTQIDVTISAAPIHFKGHQYRLVVAKDITEQKRAEKQVLNSLIEGEERERKRIAHELHDGLGQYLSASNMNFEAIKNEIEKLSEKREKQFRNGMQLLQKAIKETRNIAQNLMPTAIEDYGLELAVLALIDQLKKSTDIKFSYTYNLEDVELKEQTQINLYRIIQEALSNAIKHSNCQKISLQLYKHDHIISCTIEDNGSGYDMNSESEHQGMGIRSIRTRGNALSGEVEFDSSPGKGMTILVELPLEANIEE